VLLQHDFEVAQRYGVHGTPGAALLDRDGHLLSAPVAGKQAVIDLVARRFSDTTGQLPLATEPPLEAVTASPAVLGVDHRSGRPVPAADPDGRWTVVIETARHCPDCETVLAAASRRASAYRHRLVVLSDRGNVEVDAVVALDADRVTANALRLPGVPSVVVLDGDGHALTAPAVGTAAALATITALAPAAT
jgi:hypothetical protein